MDETPRERLIEWLVDALAATTLAAAAAFALLKLSGSGGLAIAGACGGFLLAYVGLRRVRPESVTYPLAKFAPAAVDLEEESELLLGPEMLFATEGEESELVLDDILASLAPDSRVVRLFQPVRLSSAGGLKSRIDRHLGSGTAACVPPDATQTLHDALAELRRSLR